MKVFPQLLIALAIASCNSKKIEDPGTSGDLNHSFIPVRDSFSLQWPLYPVFDSVQLHSLKSTAYLVGNNRGRDGTDYLIIRDFQTGRHYKITLSSWPTFNSRLSRELQLFILDNDSEGHIIKPVNDEWLGLELFLNNCKSLEEKEVNPNDVDAIIRLAYKRLHRIYEPSQIDSVINYYLTVSSTLKNAFDLNYIERKTERLRKKVLRKNVLIYNDYGSLLFVEINPGRNIYTLGPYYDPNGLKKDKIFYTNKQNNIYNLVFTWIDL